MQRSSSSIANLAAALAKAQIALVNPEKSLVATIRQGGASGAEQTFRYAPLSSGLEIVRKTLGEHEIATVQTTAIDQGAGIVNLTTVLAHSSGEWIASDWPVCALSETTAPHRMGAALTYARRYALFTLVGIAGEDDLDAPDLQAPTSQAAEPPKPTGHENGRLNGGARPIRDRNRSASKPILGSVQSAELRERLLAELSRLASGEDAAMWAHRSLSEKNRLTAADAQAVEQAFQAWMAAFPTNVDEFDESPARVERLQASPSTLSNLSRVDGGRRSRAKRIDKSALALPEPRRIRDRDHVRYVAKQPCLICGRRPSDPHHLRFAQNRALGRKVSDEFVVPLCRGHHREVHRCGDEAAWWSKVGVNPMVAARTLWLETHRQLAAQDQAVIESPAGNSETKPFAAGADAP
ncbi:MAG: ERF family protein [Xanthobacteraceae bacterium]